MSLRFGTDGVRGVAGSELTPELAVLLGRAAARLLGGPFVVGRDTRISGPMLQAAFSAGVAGDGADVVDLGVLPTPAIAGMAAERGLAAAVISASHNPYQDNGIKLFAAGGRKLGDDEERSIEELLAALGGGSGGGPGGAVSGPGSGSGSVGRMSTDTSAAGWYVDRLVAALEGRRLSGARVVLDCANGAAYAVASRVFEAAGASVVGVIGAAPDGININAGCGSTDTRPLSAAVLRLGADAGLAFDGDADRVIAVDGDGAVVDGDRLLGLFALDLRSRGRLADDTLVVTVMSNLGLRVAMESAGVHVHEVPVGDRNVLSALDGHGWTVGGEQSGHLIFRDMATTGDGLLSGLLLLDLVQRSGASLSSLAGDVMERFPQVLINVAVADRDGLDGSGEVWDAVRSVEAKLGDHGRVLLRPSGTEKVVRVMVEAPTEAEAGDAARRLAGVVSEALGAE